MKSTSPSTLKISTAGKNREWNNIRHKTCMSGKNVGAKALSVNMATIPPGGAPYEHIHDGFELRIQFDWFQLD